VLRNWTGDHTYIGGDGLYHHTLRGRPLSVAEQLIRHAQAHDGMATWPQRGFPPHLALRETANQAERTGHIRPLVRFALRPFGEPTDCRVCRRLARALARAGR